MPCVRSNDGAVRLFTTEQLALCNVPYGMFEGGAPDETIPLENVDGEQLDWLQRYLAARVDAPSSTREQRCMSLVEQHEDPLSLVRLANYLDVPSLQAHACMRVASVIRRCRTPVEMRRLFCDVPCTGATTLSDAACVDSFTVLMAQVSSACVVPVEHAPT